MMTVQNVTQLHEKLEAMRKVSRNLVSLEDMKNFVTTIEAINMLEEDEIYLKIGDEIYPISTFKILPVFKPLVMPSAVKFDVSSRSFNDLRMRFPLDLGIVLDPISFENVQIAMLSTLRSQKNEFISIQREVVSLDSIIGRVSIKGRAHFNDEVYIPCDVNASLLTLFKDSYLNDDKANIIKDWIRFKGFMELI